VIGEPFFKDEDSSYFIPMKTVHSCPALTHVKAAKALLSVTKRYDKIQRLEQKSFVGNEWEFPDHVYRIFTLL
jgi:Golgi nucleoside diphosphatase